MPGIGIGIGLHIPSQTPPDGEPEEMAVEIEMIEAIEAAPELDELSFIERLKVYGRRVIEKIRELKVKVSS